MIKAATVKIMDDISDLCPVEDISSSDDFLISCN